MARVQTAAPSITGGEGKTRAEIKVDLASVKAAVQAAVSQGAPGSQSSTWYEKEIRFYKLAKAYSCTPAAILAANHIPDIYDLRIGQELITPTR